MESVWLQATSSDQIDMTGSRHLEIIPEDNRIEKKSRIIEIKSNRSSWHYYMVHTEVRRGSAQAPTITFWILPRISKFFHLHNALSYRIPSRNRHLYNHKNRHLCWVDMMSQSKPRFKMLHILKMLKNTQIWTWQQRGHSILKFVAFTVNTNTKSNAHTADIWLWLVCCLPSFSWMKQQPQDWNNY